MQLIAKFIGGTVGALVAVAVSLVVIGFVSGWNGDCLLVALVFPGIFVIVAGMVQGIRHADRLFSTFVPPAGTTGLLRSPLGALLPFVGLYTAASGALVAFVVYECYPPTPREAASILRQHRAELDHIADFAWTSHDSPSGQTWVPIQSFEEGDSYEMLDSHPERLNFCTSIAFEPSSGVVFQVWRREAWPDLKESASLCYFPSGDPTPTRQVRSQEQVTTYTHLDGPWYLRYSEISSDSDAS